MKLKKSIPNFVFVAIINLLFGGFLHAQNEVQMQLTTHDTTKIKTIDLFENLKQTERLNLNPSIQFNTTFPNSENQVPDFQFQQPIHKTTFSINQQHIEKYINGLGTSQLFNNQILMKAGEKITLGFEGGLAIQNTVFNPYIPNYQITLGLTLEYTVNDRLKTYIFGRYVTSPFNKSDDYFDPFMYNNSLFLQSGTGAGIKTNMKSTLIDFQIMSGYDHQLKIMNNFNSKLRIKF